MWAQKNSPPRVDPPTFRCLLCNADRSIIRESFGVYSVVQCAQCKVLTTSPVPSPEELWSFYNVKGYYGGKGAARFRYRPAAWIQSIFRWRRARLLKRLLRGAVGRTVLDIGCGRGYTLAWLQRWGADVYGTQISEPAAEVAKGRIGAERVFVGKLEDAAYPETSFDCITLWHVLEHVPDPVSLFREIARILRPGGFVYIEVPNAGGWTARTLGRHWLAYDIPRHLIHFTPKTLQTVASRAGLSCVQQVHFSIEYSPITLLQSLLNAWVGGENLLFRLVTQESVSSDPRRRVGRTQILAHLFLAAALLTPALVWSWLLGQFRAGDILGGYFKLAAGELRYNGWKE